MHNCLTEYWILKTRLCITTSSWVLSYTDILSQYYNSPLEPYKHMTFYEVTTWNILCRQDLNCWPLDLKVNGLTSELCHSPLLLLFAFTKKMWLVKLKDNLQFPSQFDFLENGKNTLWSLFSKNLHYWTDFSLW